MTKKNIIWAAVSLTISIFIISISLLSGPVIKIESIEEPDTYTDAEIEKDDFNESDILLFLNDMYPEMHIEDYEVNTLGDLGYTKTLVDVNGDGKSEIILTGSNGSPTVILKKVKDDFNVLFQNDTAFLSRFKIDNYNNLYFSFSGNLATKMEYNEGVVLRWDGSLLREVWRGITHDFQTKGIGNGSEWFEEDGYYDIFPGKAMTLKYTFIEYSGTMLENKEKVSKEHITTKEYTFDDKQFKFVEVTN